MWASSTKQIELRDDSVEAYKRPYSVEAMLLGRKLVSKTRKGREKADRRALKIGYASPVLWTTMLFVSLPNAKELLVEPTKDAIPNAYRVLLRHYTRVNGDLLACLESYVQGRLKVLEVKAPLDVYDPVGVSYLPNLRVLIVEGECFRSVEMHGHGSYQTAVLNSTRPPGSLPPNLELLHIYGGYRPMAWTWLRERQ